MMAIFVTVVVSLYWWDWSTYIESEFVATPSEFAIDFSGLIILEFLFVHFRQPDKLAANFIALGVFDLVWVINHIRQHKEQKFFLRKCWLFQKVLEIALYTAALIFIVSFNNQLNDSIQGIAIIITAILVRLLCFREVKRRNIMNFREFDNNDIPEIIEVNKHYIDHNRKDGFLLESLSEENLVRLQENNLKKVFVAVRGAQILAYAKISYQIDNSILNSLEWLDPMLAFGVKGNEILHIEQVAVNPEYSGRGIGRSFYNWLINHHEDKIACAFVALYPRCNSSSLRFHAALGFEKTALFSRQEFWGERNYRSLLLAIPKNMPKTPEDWDPALSIKSNSLKQ
jgi:L-amino acid N-acyltransferase YncA